MKWSEVSWHTIQDIFGRIKEHPFINELSEGTLSSQRFAFYIQQDAWYLEHFGRALSMIAARASDTDDSLAFMRFAEGAIVVERQLHQSFFREFGITERGTIEPACHHYIHFLKAVAATEDVAVGMAAVLPCFRIYLETGKHILQSAQQGQNPYKIWIDTYASDAFELLTTQASAICDKMAENATQSTRDNMHQAFKIASLLEYDFWDAAYHLRKW